MDELAAAAKPGGISPLNGIIWLVRVMLPIVLFWIWYRSQLKEPDGNSYSRKEVLAARVPVDSHDPPAGLCGIRLVADTQVQKMFGLPATRQGPPGRRDSDRGKGGGKRGGGKGRGGGTTLSAFAAQCQDSGEKDKVASISDEERAQVASLLNLAAFSFKDQPKRIFLLEEGRQPPPPGRESGVGGARPSGLRGEADSVEAMRANTEAQVVLKALANPKIGASSSDVPRLVVQRLEAAGFAPSETTFSLLVQSCVSANDLRSASEFLMQMESAGHSAEHELLDKVMDLYSQNRPAVAGGSGAAAPPGGPVADHHHGGGRGTGGERGPRAEQAGRGDGLRARHTASGGLSDDDDAGGIGSRDFGGHGAEDD